MQREMNLLVALLLAAATVSAFAAATSGRLGRELLQSGVTCAKEIPYCTARRCTTRILGSKETYVCLRCQPTFVPARGVDGKSIVQCVCPTGTSFNSTSSKCDRCALGSYCPGGNTKARTKNDDIEGKSINCNPDGAAVEGLTTKFIGASRYTDCVAKGGYVLPTIRNGPAQQCEGPFYAPQSNRLRTCLRCQSGLAPPEGFAGPNVDRITVCQVPPGKFWELNVVRDCPRGLYRTTYERTTSKAAISCKSCPDYWTTNRTGSVNINECNILLPGYQVSNTTGTDLAISAQEDNWDPLVFGIEPCPIGTFYNASSPDFKCQPCPHGSVTRTNGSLSVDECMVPPGYFIAKKSENDYELTKCKTDTTRGEQGYYRSGWISYSAAIDEDATGANICTPCGEGIMSNATEADENPLAADGDKVAATSASCYISAGHGISFDPADFKRFKAVACPANTYGVANDTYGLINAPCKACGKNLKSAELSTSYTDCKNPAGFGYTSEGANQCPPNFWAAAESMAPCEPCPEGRETGYEAGNGDLQDSIEKCKVPSGSGVYDPTEDDPFTPTDPSSNQTAKQCPIGYFSTGDDKAASTTSNPVCQKCLEGQSTTEIGSTNCSTCAAGYGMYGTAKACQECQYGEYSSAPSDSCSQCPTTTFADPVGAEFVSEGLTFKTGLVGKELCVPRYAQQAAPTGDRLVLPDNMFTETTDLTAASTDEADIQVEVEKCVKACPADRCCIAQMQLQDDGKTLNCKRAVLEPAATHTADSSDTARLYYKLPPSEMAASSINDKTVAAKTISSGIYAVCNIQQWAQLARAGKIGTSFDNTKVEKDSEYINWGECTSDAQCQEMCNAQSTCWGYLFAKGEFALRGGEDSLGGRTFFSSPLASVASNDVRQYVSSW